ncbi:MAG: DUF11 domain-containing protein, partial [Planctomycetaceae bacterium]|nr:DUF11 domain-containing protein [Planctomycetaceae bacterium]
MNPLSKKIVRTAIIMKNKSLGFRIGILTLVGGICLFSALYAFAQLPPGKLTRQEIARPNPLRASQPVPVPGKIKQTALQNEDMEIPPSVNLNASPSLPAVAPPSVDVAAADPFAAPVLEFDTSMIMPDEPATPSASPLSHADPFAEQQPQAAVPANALPPMGGYTEQPRTAAATGSSGIDIYQPIVQDQHVVLEGTGMPGASMLEGLQTPHLALQKVMPEEVVLEQPATIKTVIQNVGNSVAKNVTITDRIPQGTRLLATIPEADRARNGELRWTVGNLDPNVQFIIEMKVLPLREGEIGSVASVNYSGEVSGRIAVTRPMLKVDVRAPSDVKLGEVAQIEITVSNPGTATAMNIVLEERIPEGLYHRDGRVMQHTGITSLKPRESKKLTLPLLCVGAGNLVNHVVVTADGNLSVEEKTTIRASAPVLDLEIVGAKTRFLERKSDYRLVVANKGNASAHSVALELALPAAVQFVSTNQNGVYESSSHSIHWALEELPPQEAGEIELVVRPVEKGDHTLRFIGTGENNLKAEVTQPVSIDGIPALTFEIVGDSNLVEMGKDVTYEIRVANRGTKAAENVKVRVALAE